MISYLEIDLAKIKDNFRALKKIISNAQILAVVKSNAYGHGLVPVSKAIEKVGVDYFGVDSIEEGLTLRKEKIKSPILVFGWPEPDLIEEAAEKELTLSVFDRDTVHRISKAGVKLKKPIKVHVKIETGMHRFGIYPQEVLEFFNYLKRSPKVVLEGVYSHFASVESKDKSYTFKQLGEFQKVTELLKKEGFEVAIKHIANSGAALSMPSTHLDMVRLGICLYGLFPAPELGSFFDLKSALEFKSKIVSLKKVNGNEKIGYFGSFVTRVPTLLAVVPVGYAHGYDRKLSSLAKVLVRGKRAPVIGSICMSNMMVDVSGVENVEVGDEVVLIGKQGNEVITAGELAGLLGTINYEVVARLSADLPRKYLSL